MAPRTLQPGPRTEIWIAPVDGGPPELVLSTSTVLLEAPNWAPDGRGLLLNGDGLLWRLDFGPQSELKPVPIEDLPPINNDHVLDAKRGLIYLSADDGQIYVAPIEGGTAQRVTHDPSRNHFLHGVSPDGATLAFVELPRGNFSVPGQLALVPAAPPSTAPSPPPTAGGCISTPRSSRASPATRSWPAYRPRAAPSSAWWSRSRWTGSRTCHRTASSPPTSASRRARLGTRPTSMSRCGWSARRTGATSYRASRCSAVRAASTSTVGRRTV